VCDCPRVCAGRAGGAASGTDKGLHAVGDIRFFITAHDQELHVIIEWLLVEDRGSRVGTESIGAGDMRSLRHYAAIGIADIHVVAVHGGHRHWQHDAMA